MIMNEVPLTKSDNCSFKGICLNQLPLAQDVNDDVVYEVWRTSKNYRIEFLEEKDVDRELCVIYFSSNGIYVPNTANTFFSGH